MSFSDQTLSVVHHRCGCCHGRRHCRKLFTFSSSSPEPPDLFQPNLALFGKGIQIYSNKASAIFQGEIIMKWGKKIDKI